MQSSLYYISSLFLDFIARGGGGGSGGGGGGGGGGSGGSSSSSMGLTILVFTGLILMYLLGYFLQVRFNKTVAKLVVWPVFAVFSIALFFIGEASSASAAFLIFIGMLAGSILGIKTIPLGKGYLKNKFKKTSKDVALAAQQDSSWDEASLTEYARNLFNLYQKSWSENNLEPCKLSLTPEYYNHTSLMIEALKLAKRQNIVNNPEIIELEISAIQDVEGKDGDSYTAVILANANDVLIDKSSDTILFEDNSSFTEYWNFIRINGNWLLSGIKQDTDNSNNSDTSLKQFATENGMFFSPDWGWLLLPSRGQLFGRSEFGTSDINNHVIGMQGNPGNQVLTQIYNYIPSTASDTRKNYLIVQTYLPKSYGQILVRKNKFRVFGSPRGLEKVETEWGQFNEKYEVWATVPELATSFELLHPAFMEKLEALPFELNIEVVDNVLYLYSADSSIGINDANYSVMLQIINEAFKQMKM